ncbi:TonB-dependent receptor [Qipengyuania sp. RANM35]|uniref:TonB-dependent receptor n=1 Tax=Qipengyuania sp. RANM35 TaxID=3068635 RepID=UPI0034DB2F77
MLYHARGKAALLTSLSFVALTFPQPVLAQDAVPADEPTAQEAASDPADAGDDLHDRRIDYKGEIVVTGHGLKKLDLLAGTSVMDVRAIQENTAGQIGDVLAGLPGVSATSFSPGASRPVLRGFSGERVRVLVDGIGSIDISNTSADHAVTIDPLTAERVEVLRGPAVMMYGSSAIGGAINVIDKRIPRRVPDESYHVDALVGADTASDMREAGGSLDVPLGGGFVGHVDGSWRRSDDLSIAGYQIAPALREELLGQADALELGGDTDAADELRTAALNRGTLPNSGTETWTANAGVAFFAGESNIGAAIGVYDTAYGVPTRPGGGEAEEVSIGLRQYRGDLRAEAVTGGGFLDRIRLRAAYSDYTHTEFEGGDPGTTFDVQGIEGRLEFIQADRGNWRGSFGGQYYFRDFLAVGDEAYISPNRTQQLAGFALQEFDIGPLELELAGRFEHSSVDSTQIGFARSFNAVSGAAGLSYETDGGLRFGVNASRVSRAPSAEELLANGPHIATQSFEVGDLGLKIERAWGGEIYARGSKGPIQFNLALFKSWFDNYIYQAATGDVEDGLPVYEYRQGDATYAGVEGEASWAFIDNGPVSVLLDLKGDYIDAKLADGTPLPRIPPLSLTAGLEAQSDPWDARVEVEWADDMTRTAPLETQTEGFTLLNASFTWRPIRGDRNIAIVFKADNILDVTARRHASFTKDYVPMAGRNFSANLRASF